MEIRYWLSDPKAQHAVIYWNVGKDSVHRSISVTTEGAPHILKIGNVNEGSVSFEIYNYDGDYYRDQSVVMRETVSVYGDFYQNYLTNRIVRNHEYDQASKKLTINLYDNAIGTELIYLSSAGVETKRICPMTETVTEKGSTVTKQVLKIVLEDIPARGLLEYRTMYQPEPTCVDTFNTKPTTIDIGNSAPAVTN